LRALRGPATLALMGRRRAAAMVLLAGVGACGTSTPRRAGVEPAAGSAQAAVTLTPPAPDAAPAPPDGPPPPPPRATSVELAFGGDVMFGRYIKNGFKAIPADQVDPFTDISSWLRSDFTLVNLETTVMAEPPAKSPYGTLMRFTAPPRRVAVLPRHGVTNVTLANNHWYDMRAEGVRETPLRLAELGIRAFGAARLDRALLVETAEVQGWKIGVIAAAALVNHDPVPGEPAVPYRQGDDLIAPIAALLAEARASHDLLLVAVHWGTEYKDAPEPWRVKAGRAWIDAGADAVIGHHPHVLQGIERYQGGLIAYSLGNLLFDNLNPLRRDGGVLRLRFVQDGASACLAGARFHATTAERDPTQVLRQAGPHGTRRRITDRLTKLSKAAPLRTSLALDGDDLVIAGACAATEPASP
jgi:poly-gamma-glutamate capsule biosynthesis protein CapA/YwtB (metallophosphatase superfamily)